MNIGDGNGIPVAPHGILVLAVACMVVLVLAHTAGFRAMGAVNFGK